MFLYQCSTAESAEKGVKVPVPTKTGTTIVGIVFKDGVILGADTRSTSDTIVADKNCSKIHYLASNMYCCGAGTAADTEFVTRLIASQLELHRLNTNSTVPVIMALTLLKRYLFKYQGHVGAALVLGGMDNSGPSLFSINPHGNTAKMPYSTLGSGSLAAMSVFESRWKKDMSLEEGKKLVRDAIAAGVFNDLGSGTNIDMCIITKDKVDYIRPYEVANKRGVRQKSYKYKQGSTSVLKSLTVPYDVVSSYVEHVPMEE